MPSPRSSKPWGDAKASRASSIYVPAGIGWAIDSRPRQPPIRRQWPVVPHVVIRPKIHPFLHEQRGRIGNFKVKTAEIVALGRNTADVVRGAIEACRLEATEPAGVRLGGGGDAVRAEGSRRAC